MFSLRIVTTDHYMSSPLHGLDVQYSDLRGSEVKKVPVVRVYGSTPAGQKTCMHIHGVFPYLYVPYDGTAPLDRYLRQFAASLDKAINVAQGHGQSNLQHVYKIVLVSGLGMYGYHSKDQPFLKIYMSNPQLIRKAADLLLGGAVMNKPFQPHESHIPYTLQLFIDYNLYGMNLINVAAVKFRRKLENENEKQRKYRNEVLPTSQCSDGGPGSDPATPLLSRTSSLTPALKHWDYENIPSDMFLDGDVERQSVCELEVDVVAADILNRLEVNANVGANPGLAALWEDERQRRRERGESIDNIAPPASQERVGVDVADSEKILRERLKQIIQDLEPYMDSQSDSEMDMSQDDAIPSTQASQLDLHLSMQDDLGGSQDTVMMENDDVEAMINEASVRDVVSRSESFCERNPDLQNVSSQDRSLVDILAALAGDTSLPSSQQAVVEAVALEEHDSMLAKTSNLLDTELDKLEEEEILEMSQKIWDGEERDAEGTDYNIEGMDTTWVESQSDNGPSTSKFPPDMKEGATKGDKSESDDSDSDIDTIPQYDGPVDENPTKREVKDMLTKRLGMRGQAFVTNMDMGMMQEHTNHYGQQYGAANMGQNYGAYQTQQQQASMAMGQVQQRQYPMMHSQQNPGWTGGAMFSQQQTHGSMHQTHRDGPMGQPPSGRMYQSASSMQYPSTGRGQSSAGPMHHTARPMMNRSAGAMHPMQAGGGRMHPSQGNISMSQSSMNAYGDQQMAMYPGGDQAGLNQHANPMMKDRDPYGHQMGQYGNKQMMSSVVQQGFVPSYNSAAPPYSSKQSAPLEHSSRPTHQPNHPFAQQNQNVRHNPPMYQQEYSQQIHPQQLPTSMHQSYTEPSQSHLHGSQFHMLGPGQQGALSHDNGSMKMSSMTSVSQSQAPYDTITSKQSVRHHQQQQPHGSLYTANASDRPSSSQGLPMSHSPRTSNQSPASDVSNRMTPQPVSYIVKRPQSRPQSRTLHLGDAASKAVPSPKDLGFNDMDMYNSYDPHMPLQEEKLNKSPGMSGFSQQVPVVYHTNKPMCQTPARVPNYENVPAQNAARPSRGGLHSSRLINVSKNPIKPEPDGQLGPFSPSGLQQGSHVMEPNSGADFFAQKKFSYEQISPPSTPVLERSHSATSKLNISSPDPSQPKFDSQMSPLQKLLLEPSMERGGAKSASLQRSQSRNSVSSVSSICSEKGGSNQNIPIVAQQSENLHSSPKNSFSNKNSPVGKSRSDSQTDMKLYNLLANESELKKRLDGKTPDANSQKLNDSQQDLFSDSLLSQSLSSTGQSQHSQTGNSSLTSLLGDNFDGDLSQQGQAGGTQPGNQPKVNLSLTDEKTHVVGNRTEIDKVDSLSTLESFVGSVTSDTDYGVNFSKGGIGGVGLPQESSVLSSSSLMSGVSDQSFLSQLSSNDLGDLGAFTGQFPSYQNPQPVHQNSQSYNMPNWSEHPRYQNKTSPKRLDGAPPRKRGRPPKNSLSSPGMTPGAPVAPGDKKRRGRPRKSSVTLGAATPTATSPSQSVQTPFSPFQDMGGFVGGNTNQQYQQPPVQQQHQPKQDQQHIQYQSNQGYFHQQIPQQDNLTNLQSSSGSVGSYNSGYGFIQNENFQTMNETSNNFNQYMNTESSVQQQQYMQQQYQQQQQQHQVQQFQQQHQLQHQQHLQQQQQQNFDQQRFMSDSYIQQTQEFKQENVATQQVSFLPESSNSMSTIDASQLFQEEPQQQLLNMDSFSQTSKTQEETRKNLTEFSTQEQNFRLITLQSMKRQNTLVQNNAWHCMPGRSSVSDVWQSPVVRPSPSPAYTFKFHVPSADCDKHYVLKNGRSPSPGVVRMHPKDARKFSLLKIGREVIELKRLSTEKVKRIKSELLKGALVESIPPPLRKIPQEGNPVISNVLSWGDIDQSTAMEGSPVESAIHNSIQGYSNQTSNIIQYGNRYTGLTQFGTAQTINHQKDTVSVDKTDVNVLSDDTPVSKHQKSSPENKDKSKSMFRNKNIANIPHLKKYRAGFSYFGKGSVGRGGHAKFRKSHPVLRPEFEDDSSIVLKDVSLNDGIITPIKSRTPIAGRSPAYSSGHSVGELDSQDKEELESKLKSLYDIDLNQSQNAQMFNEQMFGDDEENSEDDEVSSGDNSVHEDEDQQLDSIDDIPDKDKQPQNLNKIDMENKENLFTSSKETISNSLSEAKVMVKTVPEMCKVKERRDIEACVDEMSMNFSKGNAEEKNNRDVSLAEGIETDSEFSKVNPANVSMSEELGEESGIQSSNDSDLIQNSNELDLDERNHSTAFYGKFKKHFKEKFAQFKTTNVQISDKCKAENQVHSVDENQLHLGSEKPHLDESKSKSGDSSDIKEKKLDDGKSNQRQLNSKKPHISISRSNSGTENYHQKLDSSKLPRNRSRSNSSDSRGSTSRCGSRRSSTAQSVESVILSSESSSVLSGSMHTAKTENKVRRKKRKSHSLSSGSRKSSRSSSVDNDIKKTKKSKTAKYHKKKPYNIDSDSDGVPGVDYIVTGKFKGYREMKVKVSKIPIDSKTEVVNVNDFMKKVGTEKNGYHCNNVESLGISDHKQIATNAKQVPVKGFSAEFEKFLASKSNTLNGDDDDALISDSIVDEKPHYVVDKKEKGHVENDFETEQLKKSAYQIETHDGMETNTEVHYETDEKNPQNSAMNEKVTLDLDDIELSTLKEDTEVQDQIEKEEKLNSKSYNEHEKETEGHSGTVKDTYNENIKVVETHTKKDEAICAQIDKERKTEMLKSTDEGTEVNNENNNETKTDILCHGTNDVFNGKCKTVCCDIDQLNDIKELNGNNCTEVLTNGPIQESVKDNPTHVPKATKCSKVKEVDQSCDREKGNKGFSSSTEDEGEPVQATKKKQVKTIRKYSDVKRKRSSDRLANAFCGPKGKRKRPQKKKKPLKWMSTLDVLHDATMEKLTANKVYDGDIVSNPSPVKCQDDNEIGTNQNPVISVIAPDFEVYCDRAIDYDDNYSDTLFRLAYYSPMSSENGNNSSPQPLSPEEMKPSAAESDDMKVEKLIEHREQKMTLADIMKSVRQSDEDSMTKQSDDSESRNTECDLTVKADLPVNGKANDVQKSHIDIKACIGEEDEIKRTDMSSPPDLGPPVIHRYYSDHDLTEDQNPPPNLTPNRKMSSDSKNDFEIPCVSDDGTVPSLQDSYHELSRNPPPFLSPYRSPRLPPPSPRGSPRMAEIAGNKAETPSYLESPCEQDYKVKSGKSPGANSSTGSINVIHSEQFSDISDDDFHYDGKGDDADTSPIIATQNQKTLNMDGSQCGKVEVLDKETKLREIKEFEERLAGSDMNRNNIFDIMSSQNGQIREYAEINSIRMDCVSSKEQFVRNVQLLLNKEPNTKTMNDIAKGNSLYDNYSSRGNDRLERDQVKHIHKDNGLIDSDTAMSVKRCHSVSTDRDIMESFHHSQVLTDNSRSLFDSVSSVNGFWNSSGLHHGATNGFKTSEKSGEISKTSTNPLNALIDFHKNHAPPKWSSFQSFQSFDDNGERIIKYAPNSHSRDLFESSGEKSRNNSQHSNYQPSFNRSLSESSKYDYSIVRNRKLNDSIIKSVAYQVNMRDKEFNSRNQTDDKITEEPPADKGGKNQKSKRQKDNPSNLNTSTGSDINEQGSKDYPSESQGRDNKGQDKGQKSDCKISDSMNAVHVITPLVPPPSRADVQHSFGRFGLGALQHSGPFYSNHRDVPCKPRESGGQVFKVPSSLVKDLDEFSHSASITRLEDWRGLFCVNDNVFMSQSDSNIGVQEQLARHPQLKYALTGDRPVVICPFDGPPSLNKVTKWCKGRKLYKNLKNQALQKEKHGSCDNRESKRDDNVPVVKRVDIGKRKADAASKNDENVESEGKGRSAPKGNKIRLNLFTGKREFCVDEDSNDSSRDGSQGSKTTHDIQGPSTGNESLTGSPKCNPELNISPTGLPNIDSQIGSPSLTSSQPENEESFLHSTPLLRRQSTELFAPECTPISERQMPVETDEQAQFVTPKRIKSLRSRRPSAGPDRSLRQSLINTQLKRQFVTPETNPNDVSQIEGPSLKNSFGFKLSQPNFQTAKTLHEFQHLTVMSLEVHAESRGDLQPDPEVDAIQAVFYSIFNDVPPEQGTRYETGVFILDPASANQEKDEKTTANQEKDDKSSANQNRGNRYTSPKPGSSLDNKAVGGLKTLLQKSAVFDLKVLYFSTEMELLYHVKDFITEWDPDILVGYEIQMLSWGYILQRASVLSYNLTQAISRVPTFKHSSHHSAERDEWGADHHSEIHIAGRIVLNLWRILRHEVTLNIYSFENVAFHVLHRRVPKYSCKSLTSWFNHRTHQHRWKVIDYYVTRVKGQLDIMDKLDLVGRTSEFARVFGIEFYHVLSRGSQYRVESMMLRVAKPLNYIPVSPSVHQRARMKAPECIALTLEPESKFYTDPVIVLDFQSLYPSIMIAYNYCFSTCLGRLEWFQNAHEGPIEFGCTSLNLTASTIKDKQKDVTISPNGIVFCKQSVKRGVLPLMVEEILNTRLMVKKAMPGYKDDKTLSRLLHARQLGLKLIANVTYGYTAANFSGRMPCIEVGDSIVRKARETLERSIKLVEETPEWGAKVIYGDTDSMFLLLKGCSKDQAFKIGQDIAQTVTRMFPQPIKLKFEKVYLPCVLQTKKRYCGFMYETPDQKEPVYDAKGIETVRRDSCSAVSKMLERSIKILFTTKDVSQVKSYVQQQCKKVMEGTVSLQDYIFAKEYRGIPGYKPGACVPALEISKKLLRADKRSEPRVGERVPYVIVYGSPGLPLIQLVRQPLEVLQDLSLRLNSVYYITKQILPPLSRFLSLLGVDVFSWYNEMPHSAGRVATQFGVTAHNRKGTISQYFATSNCPLCDEMTKQPVCWKCMRNPQLVCITLNDKIRYWERVNNHLEQICKACTGSPEATTGKACISLDCPILYRKSRATGDMDKVTAYRNILEKVFKS